MATLSGQTIQDTYDGLLKLEDSTNPISSSLQNIQDGLGNNTGFRIAQNQLFHRQLTFSDNFKPDYGGVGIVNSFTSFSSFSGMQNKLVAQPFYDSGLYTYSSITYYLAFATTRPDTVNVAFYDSQFVDGVGLAPKNLIMSGISLNVSTTGMTETALPSNLTFTGGQQYYFMCFIVSNSGVTPNVQYRTTGDAPTGSGLTNAVYGNSIGLGMALLDVSGIYYIRPGGRATSTSNTPYTLGFQTSYSSSDISTNTNLTPSITGGIGFILKTI